MTQAEQATQQDLARQRDRTESYLRADPKNKQLLTRAVELSLALGDTAGAGAHANAALSLYPDDAFIQCLNGHVLSAQHKWPEAAAVYAAILKQRSDPDLAYSLANCLVWQGQYQAALDTMAPFLQDPDLPADTVTLIVRALHHVEDLEGAIAFIERHGTRLAAEPLFLAAASVVYLDHGDVLKAAELSKAALDLGARPIEAVVAAASVSLAQAESDLAIAQFKEAIALNPQEGRGWAGIGMANLLNRDIVNGAMQLEKAVKLLPNHIGSWHALGWCRVFGDDLVAAERAFVRALEIDRNFAESHGSLASVFALRGQRAEAEASIDRALRLDPTSLSARYAQMILAGETADSQRFHSIAMRLISGRKTAFGVELGDVVRRYTGT